LVTGLPVLGYKLMKHIHQSEVQRVTGNSLTVIFGFIIHLKFVGWWYGLWSPLIIKLLSSPFAHTTGYALIRFQRFLQVQPPSTVTGPPPICSS
jgi:hypothetical protein